VAAGAAALVALGMVLAGCSAFASSSPTSIAKAPPGVDPHRREAQVSAAALLASYRPPPGSVQLSSAPTGPWIGKPPSSQATSELIDLTRAWRTPGNMVSVIAWAKAHAQSHWSMVETGESGQNPKGQAPPTRNGHPIITDVKSRDVTFSLPVHDSAVESRQVLVSVASRGMNEVTLRVDVQVVWIPTRPTWSYVSRAATSVTATVWTGTNRFVPTTKTSSDPSTVASLRKLVNAMSVSTVGLTSCPADVGQRFSLEFKGSNAPRVTVSGLTAECGGISIIVPGHGRLGMRDAGARVVSAVEALTGVK
jgi:hypothetical protein